MAYPSEAAPKKKKKEKKIGTGYVPKDKLKTAEAVADGTKKVDEAPKEALGESAADALEKLKVDG